MSYADHQQERDSAYLEAYRTWVDSLAPAERARLEAGGVLEPDVSRHTSTRQHDEALLERTAAPEVIPFEGAAEAPAASPASAADVLASFCARIRSHPNPLLAFDAACFASGLMEVEGLSEAALAQRHGVTRAAFSKLVIQWSETFGLPPSRGMRSKRARHAYRKARLTSLAQRHEPAAA
jgi:hypothetical protein